MVHLRSPRALAARRIRAFEKGFLRNSAGGTVHFDNEGQSTAASGVTQQVLFPPPPPPPRVEPRGELQSALALIETQNQTIAFFGV